MTDPSPAVPELPDWLKVANEKASKLEAGIKSYAAAIGEVLLTGKKSCKHGEFTRLVDQHFIAGRRMAQYFMAIAENPTFSNTKHVSYLPADVLALGRLAQIPAPSLEPMLGKEVTKDMNRDQAAILVKRWKLKQKARAAAAQRHAKGLPPKPAPLTGDAAKAEKARLAEARAEKLALIDSIPEDALADLGLIACRENDLAEFATYTPEHQMKIRNVTRGGLHNTLKAANEWLDATDTGTVHRGHDLVPTRIVYAMVQLPDILNPVMSLLGQLETMCKVMVKRFELYPAAELSTWGRAPGLLKALLDSVEQQKRALSFQIPYAICELCDGQGIDGAEKACPSCRADLSSPKSPGWICIATAKKRQADKASTDKMLGR